MRMFSLLKSFTVSTAVLASLLLLSHQAMSCGTVRGWIVTYESGQRYKALFHMLDCASSYEAPGDDIALLPVIADALGRNAKIAGMAMQVFQTYNRLYGARGQKTYGQVARTIAQAGKPVSLEKFRDWMVVTARGGANMRSKPSLNGEVITALIYGMQAKVIQKSGEWIKVKAVGPGSVDPRFERKAGYVHESLLEAY